MGSSYVLGNREEDNQYTPYKVHPKMFEEFPVREVACGTLHCVVLATNDKANKNSIDGFEPEVINFVLPVQEPANKKRSRAEFEGKSKASKENINKEEVKESHNEVHGTH